MTRHGLVKLRAQLLRAGWHDASKVASKVMSSYTIDYGKDADGGHARALKDGLAWLDDAFQHKLGKAEFCLNILRDGLAELTETHTQEQIDANLLLALEFAGLRGFVAHEIVAYVRLHPDKTSF